MAKLVSPGSRLSSDQQKSNVSFLIVLARIPGLTFTGWAWVVCWPLNQRQWLWGWNLVSDWPHLSESSSLELELEVAYQRQGMVFQRKIWVLLPEGGKIYYDRLPSEMGTLPPTRSHVDWCLCCPSPRSQHLPPLLCGFSLGCWDTSGAAVLYVWPVELKSSDLTCFF